MSNEITVGKELGGRAGAWGAAGTVDVDNLGELPRSYGTNALCVLPQEPHWLFAYWDIDISRHPGGPAFLRVSCEGEVESEIEVHFETRNWYIPVKRAGAVYTVEIGYRRGGRWHPLAEPAQTTTPPDHLSSSTDFEVATLPLHLGFARLMKELRGAMARGESLTGALARLQREGGQVAGQEPALASGLQLLLEAILGPQALKDLSSGAFASGAFSSEQLAAKLRAALEEKLASALGASWSAAAGESSLSSLFAAVLRHLPESSWQAFVPSSWGLEQVSSWLERAVTSWARAAESSFAAESAASWARAAESSFAAETLASWARAAESSWAVPSSWGIGEVSSWLAAALASWAAAVRAEIGPLSSEVTSFARAWVPAELGSWARAAESSAFSESLASWARAAESSLLSESLASWARVGAQASWSGASEYMASPGLERGFFMHVNAEVIFYGGTDPCARVTVDGKPITLAPDGTFRFHFLFPNGSYEIPIVAISPDGVETRCAVLRFERRTEKTGKVDDTPQPPLGVPMGAKG